MRCRPVALLSLLIPGTAGAQYAAGTPGTLVAVVLAPLPLRVGSPAIITLSGFGECGQVLVNFGDGSSTAVTGVKFPRSVQHTYARTGTVTVTATRGMNCTAKQPVQATTTVQESLVNVLCARTGGCDADARPASCTTPAIHSLLYAAPLEPADMLSVRGCGFGTPPAGGGSYAARVVRLKGSFGPHGAAVGLSVIRWADDLVLVKVPALAGVLDQTAKVQVVRDAAVSNEMAVSFRAARHLQVLNEKDGVLRQSCGEQQWSWAICDHFFGVFGVHRMNASMFSNVEDPGAGEVLTGVDFVLVNLANGWVIHKFEPATEYIYSPAFQGNDFLMVWQNFDLAGSAYKVDANNLNIGSPAGGLVLRWSMAPGQKGYVRGKIWVKGPIGVAMK